MAAHSEGFDAGLWPRSTDDLIDPRRCPACFTPLTSAVCSLCGLDLSGPRAHELLRLSEESAGALLERSDLIRTMRAEQRAAAQRPVAPPAPAPAPAPAPVVAPPTLLAPVPSAPHASPVPAPASAPLAAPVLPTERTDAAGDEPRRRRSSVQVVLLLAGVVLVGVAAVFFLTVAWITGGLVMRAVVIGILTLLALAISTALRRRLEATAEGIGWLAVILLLLDVWAARANDLFAAGTTDAGTYWGAALTVLGLAFVGWAWLSRLRAASIAASLALPIGVGVLVSSFVDGDGMFAVFAGLAAAALSTLIHPLLALGRRGDRSLGIERSTLHAVGATSLVGASALAPWVFPDHDAGPILSGGIVTVVAAAFLVRGLRFGSGAPLTTVTSAIAGVVGAVSLSAAPAFVALRTGDESFALIVPPAAAVAVALALELVARRTRPAAPRIVAVSASIGAAAVAVICLIAPLGRSFAAWAETLLGAERLWRAPLVDPVRTPLGPDVWATLGLAVAVALAAVFWFVGGMTRARGTGLAWAAAVVLLGAPALLQTPLGITVAGLVIALAALAALARRGGLPRGATAPLVALAIAASFSAWLASFANAVTWWATTIVIVLAIYAARFIATAAVSVVLSTVLTVFVVQAAGTALLVAPVARGADFRTAEGLGAAVIASAALLLLASLRLGRALSNRERRAVLLTGVALILPLAYVATFASPTPLSVAIGSLVGAVGALIALRSGTTMIGRSATIATGIAVAPLVTFAGLTLAELLSAEPLVGALLPSVVAILVAGGALALARRDASGVRRIAVEIGVALTVVLGLVMSTAVADAPPIALILLAVVLLIAATDRTGLFGSQSLRKHLVWAAFAAGTAGLWLRLGSEGIDSLGSWTLAPAGALAVIAALTERARRRETGTPSPADAAPRDASTSSYSLDAAAPAVILFAASVLALLPFVIEQRDSLGGIIAASIGALLLIVGTWVRARAADAALVLATGAAGAAVVLTAMTLRATGPWFGEEPNDIWLLAGLAVVGVAAVGFARSDTAVHARTSSALVVAGAVLFVLGESTAIAVEGGPIARSLFATLLLAALGAASVEVSRAPLGRLTAWTAIGGSAVVTATALATTSIRPIEWLTIPLVVGLAATAWAARRPATRRESVALWAIALVLGFGASIVALEPDELVRPFIISATAAVLLIGAAAAGRRGPIRAPYIFATLAISAPALVITTGIQSIRELPLAETEPGFDLWLVSGALPVLIAGWLLFAARPNASSWPFLAPGLVLLLVPPLLLDFTGTTLWRATVLGVVALALLVVGARAKLQAPFVLGGGVLIVHAVAQLWPWITLVYESVFWWIWLGIGGVLLIVVAATYERRIREFKAAALAIAHLR
ncbi:SCO7613 C-terminal domain-containing membrane protein [Agromyces atrinae]|uniref:DUF2157 domain-containing protein n=1 Tax=Agromyces atrinae TaxID=592376 RepID=A0A4Q2M4Y8_9MICO|nr:hypothetical protein [Agromyces atrinae]NYD66487.1 hypothetical protein [Agromyces atrinae]RXZ87164.1 hypothetical protein ESP50_04360 [Agromyces atrinae]